MRDPTPFIVVVVLASLLTVGLNLVGISPPIPVTFADDGDKECKKNEGGNNCNDSKKSASPELECKHKIKNNEESVIDSECTNNSQILIVSSIGSRNGDGVGNPDSTPFIVTSTTPQDDENNVGLSSRISLNFSKNVNSFTVSPGSLIVSNLDGPTDPVVEDFFVDQNIVTFALRSTSGSLFPLEPGSRYEATISSTIKAVNGNSLDCDNSQGIDSNCQWQFTTITPSKTVAISLDPTSGPTGTFVKVNGSGFAPISNVAVLFDGPAVASAVTGSIGNFTTNFTVPVRAAVGDHIVTAVQGSDSTSKPFTVTTTTGTATSSNSPLGSNNGSIKGLVPTSPF